MWMLFSLPQSPFVIGHKLCQLRTILIFNSLNWLPSNINIDVNLLTKGSDLLTYEENITIFKHAFKYIKDSKRFTIV